MGKRKSSLILSNISKLFSLVFLVFFSSVFSGCDYFNKDTDVQFALKPEEEENPGREIKECAEDAVRKMEKFSADIEELLSDKNEADFKNSEEIIKTISGITGEIKLIAGEDYNLENPESKEYAVQLLNHIADFTGSVTLFGNELKNIFIEKNDAEITVNIICFVKAVKEISALKEDIILFSENIKSAIVDGELIESVNQHVACIEENFSGYEKYENEIYSLIDGAEKIISEQIENEKFTEEIISSAEKAKSLAAEIEEIDSVKKISGTVKIISRIKQLSDEIKTSASVQDGVFKTLTDLKKCGDYLSELILEIGSDEILKGQAVFSSVSEKAGNISAEINELFSKLKAVKQAEIKKGLAQKIIKIKKDASSIKELASSDDFDANVKDTAYAKIIADEAEKIELEIDELIGKNGIENLVADESAVNNYVLELQLILRDVQEISEAAGKKIDEILDLIEKEKLEKEKEEAEKYQKKNWTTIIYMAADNNLESAAIQDLNELEAVCLDNADMNILVLLDRSDEYDGTNDDWTDTRLFEVQTDPNGKDGTIKSKRIDCPELDIYADKTTELDMGNSYILSELINFSKRVYPAKHYALVMWGHGTGWRGTSINGDGHKNSKAVAVDEKSRSYMTVPKLGNAVKDKGLDIIAFDTCFGAVIENFYELKNSAKYLIGAAGRVSTDGFDYSKMMTDYIDSAQSVLSYATCIANSTNESISIVKAGDVQAVADGIDDLAAAIAASIGTEAQQTETLKLLLHDVDSYVSDLNASELFLDIYDLAKKYSSSESERVKNYADSLMSAMEQTVVTTNSETPRIGIYFMSLINRNCPAPSYNDEYTNGKSGVEKSAFVNEKIGWVPTESGNISLLDKLIKIVIKNGGEL